MLFIGHIARNIVACTQFEKKKLTYIFNKRLNHLLENRKWKFKLNKMYTVQDAAYMSRVMKTESIVGTCGILNIKPIQYLISDFKLHKCRQIR